MSNLLRCVFGVLVVGAGLREVAAKPETPIVAKAQKREVTTRAELPKVIAPLVPRHGIYAAGGGLVSSGWRVVVDFDAASAGTIYGGATPKQGGASYAKQPGSTTKSLSKADREKLLKLAGTVWAEKPPSTPPRPTADYDEVLIVADGDDVFFLEGYGPIRRAIAAKAITELRALARM